MQIKISMSGDTFGVRDMRCHLRYRHTRKTKIGAFVLSLAAQYNARSPLLPHLDTAHIHLPFFLSVYFPHTDLYADKNPNVLENLAARIYSFVENNTFVRKCRKVFLSIRNA